MFNTIINAIESLLITNFYINNIKLKYNKTYSFFIMSLMMFIFISILNSLIIYEGIVSLIYILFDTLIMYILAKNHISYFIIISIICNLVTSIINQTTVLATSYFNNIDTLSVYANNTLLIIAIITSKIMFMIISLIIIKFNHKFEDLLSKYRLYLLAILSLTYTVISILQKILLSNDLAYNSILLASYISIAIIILLFILMYKIKIDSLDEINKQTLSNQLKNMEYQFKIYEKSNENIAILRHDMNNILLVIDQYLSNNELSKAHEYINKNIKIIARNKSLVITNIPAIDCVINSYQSISSEKNVQFIYNIDKNVISLINEMDLSILLANMLSNAIENCIVNSSIELTITNNTYTLLIKVTNSVDHNILKANPSLTSTKADTINHGYGIKSINHIADKYNGTVNFIQNENLFSCIINIPIH